MKPDRPLALLPKDGLTPTSDVDHPTWNHLPVLRGVQRLRFRIIVDLLAGTRFPRLLDIGYGSGVFLPELARHCDDLHGVDPHQKRAEVEANLARHGVSATLTTASVENLPYDTGSFDCLVSVSTLEYVPDIEAACAEMRRVLRPGGALVLCTPGTGALWNVPLRLLTRQGPSQYGDRRERLQPALRGHFRVDREIRVPNLATAAVRLYTGLLLRTG
ncbi:Methyltransferase domain-containing protein [Lentzea albidocapillata subsp. violacea]|uniref:Methyltransferase domain-containing protein n=1 Tax=Lentzea albidocapillata subsp. violacea TaxID=128104 RepID=A0A1G8SH82_9PSEU|nr:class I SAM-dependent methyltransferase [Lentzea albidocapillata]SDJ28612.1 Methyltransferase domain-containing protein [Lentzea albidocapillata subsp. violacea]